jgi:hypothetical protein
MNDNVKRRDLGPGGMDLTGTNQRAEIVETLRNLQATVKGLLIAQTGVFIMLLGILIVLWSRP